MSLKLPQFEMYEEGSQIRRSSKAIAVNIVEGFGRKRYQSDYIKFIVYAHASCDETIEHIELLFQTHSFTDSKQYGYFKEEFDKLSRKINKFLQFFEREA